MAHGNRTKRVSGELISSSMISPITSAEQVWDYSLLDNENNPKTVEQLNCEFKQDITQLQQTLSSINTELNSKQNIIEDLDLIRNKASTAQLPATTLAGYGITDTYTKLEVDNLVNHQNYITVSTYSALPDIGSTNTIYRVSSWDGTSTDVTKYTEYAWDDVSSRYVFLCVKSLISEVFDISVYNNTAYADLPSALGTGGINVPLSLRKGGMSVKFIQSSDNKYVQYRLMSGTFNITPANWQGVDDEPTAGSDNLVKSGGVKKAIDDLGDELERETESIKEEIIEENRQMVQEVLDEYHPIYIQGNVTNAPDEEDITSKDDLLKFKNRGTLYGKGKIILRKNKSFASQLTQENTVYVIQYNFNLDEETVSIPNNCTLYFDGGILINGDIVFNNTEIINGNNSILCNLSGTIKNRRVCIDWVIESNIINSTNVSRISSLWSIDCEEYEFTNKEYTQSIPLLIPSDKEVLKLYGNDATIIGAGVVLSKYSIQFKDHAGGNVYIENLNFGGYRISIFGNTSTFGSFEINGFKSSNNIHAFKLISCEIGDLIIKNVDISSCELGIVTNTNVNINRIYLSNIKVRDIAINKEITSQLRDSDGSLSDVPNLGGIRIQPYDTQYKQSAIIENILVENCVIKGSLLEQYDDETTITGFKVTLNHSIQGSSIVANNIIVRNWDISEANYKIGNGCYFGAYTSTLSNIIIYDAGGDEAMMSIKRHSNLNVVNCSFEMSDTYRSYLSTRLGQGIITSAPYSRIHGCTFRGINGAGIRGYASYVHLSYNKFYGCGAAYIDAGSSYSDLKEIHIDNCLLLDNSKIIYQNNPGLATKETKVYINDCKIYNISDFYSILDHVKAIYITNNVIEVNPNYTGFVGSINNNDTTAECNILLFKDNVFRNTNPANTSSFIGQYATAKQIIVKNNVISGGFIKLGSSSSLRPSIQKFVIADNIIDNTIEVIRFFSSTATSELGRKVLAIYNNIGYDYTPTRVLGATNLRPLSGRVGQSYYDITLKKLLFISEITENEGTVEVTWVDALGNPVETVYPKVLGTPVTGNLAAFNGTDIEDSNANSITE